MTQPRRPKWMIALAVLLATVATGCGQERSAEAFCNTMAEESERLAEKYQVQGDQISGADDPFTGLMIGMGALLEAQGDQVVLLDKLEKVAPEEIQADVAILRDAGQAQLEATRESGSDPLGALFSGLMTSFQTQGSARSVDTFTLEYCTA